LEPSLIHSGSGIFRNCIRCILFWSGSPIEHKEMYDPEVQEDIFTLMFEVIREIPSV
jgi:hypothetical protein